MGMPEIAWEVVTDSSLGNLLDHSSAVIGKLQNPAKCQQA